MQITKLYRCDPDKNVECEKTHCFINGGPCEKTDNKEYEMKTVVFDFDGVIHSYTSGWRGPEVIPDPPVEGIVGAIKSIYEAGYAIVIVSTRCVEPSGKIAIENWLDKHGMTQYISSVSDKKPPAIVYIDDRAICFDGKAENLLEMIKAFKPWYK